MSMEAAQLRRSIDGSIRKKIVDLEKLQMWLKVIIFLVFIGNVIQTSENNDLPVYTWFGIILILGLPIVEKFLFVTRSDDYRTLVILLSVRNLFWFFDSATAIAYILYHIYETEGEKKWQPI